MVKPTKMRVLENARYLCYEPPNEPSNENLTPPEEWERT